jgi:hypothetical protein
MPKECKQVVGENLRYWVESSQEGEPHFVDLLEDRGNGHCSCPHYQIVCRRKYREAGRIINHGYPNATRCKHINTAMLFLSDQLIQQARENYENYVNSVNHSV